MLVLVAGLLIFDVLAERMTVLGSRFTGSLPTAGGDASSAWGAFSVGSLLGFVWLPCVGPTLGAAIGLASMGQAMPLAFATMVAYGLGTASMLLAVGLASRELLLRARPRVDGSVVWAKRGLGLTMGVLGLLVLTGLDKRLEAWGVGWLPDWTVAL
jgi:cytochrome c biogenesis protein CcdA